MLDHYPNEAFELGGTFFPDNKDLANDCASALLGFEEFYSKKDIKEQYLKGEIKLKELFTYSRVFISKKGVKDFSKIVGAESYKTIQGIEDGTIQKPSYESILKLATKVLKIDSKEELTKFLDAVKSEIVNEGLVKKKGYVDDVLQKNKKTRKILTKTGIL